MKISVIGGGPAGLYLGILLRRADPGCEVAIVERGAPDDTFGFGVVFSDATLSKLAAADPESYAQIREHFAHWDDIDTHVGGEVWRSTGHGFCGLSRKELLLILQRRCAELGVQMSFESEVASAAEVETMRKGCDVLVGADGLGSLVRQSYAEHFGPDVDVRPNRFVWMGTSFPFEAFTFYFKDSPHGLFRVHAYRYTESGSTFIVECTDETFRATGLGEDDEDGAVAYLEELFGSELAGHRLVKNKSIWRRFPTVRNRSWHHENAVLVGDAAHTAHFSIGSGTKLAMEDAIDLASALGGLGAGGGVGEALARYERGRRPEVERIQRAAQVSLEWFETAERYRGLAPLQFTFSLLTRSLRVTHENLRVRDPGFVAAVDRWFAGSGEGEAPPPMFTPLSVRGLTLDNRVVASATPLCRSVDGKLGDLHTAVIGARALGGAGLVMAEWAAVSADARVDAGSAGLYDDAQIESFGRLAALVHGDSEARLGVCLGHAGRKGMVPVGPSPLSYGDAPAPRVLDAAAMAAVAANFAAAAERAAAAGLDLVDLDLADGHLLASFLSPLSNHRDDDSGGSLEARLRFPLEVVAAVRARYQGPLSVRLCARDWIPGGITGDDAVVMARALGAAGVDLVFVTSGGTVPGERVERSRLFQTPLADRVRQEAGVATVAEGGIASHDDINSILAAGRADLCALGRALVFDPSFVHRAARAQGQSPRLPAAYHLAEGFTPRGPR